MELNKTIIKTYYSHDGYVRAMTQGVGTVNLARYIMENKIGRKLKTDEHVHHINNVKDDNRIENLMVMNAFEHMSMHRKGRRPNNYGKKNARAPKVTFGKNKHWKEIISRAR